MILLKESVDGKSNTLIRFCCMKRKSLIEGKKSNEAHPMNILLN